MKSATVASLQARPGPGGRPDFPGRALACPGPRALAAAVRGTHGKECPIFEGSFVKIRKCRENQSIFSESSANPL